MGKVFNLGSTPKAEPVIIDNSAAERAAAEAKAKKDALDRQRRGGESTIKTSYNGILEDNNAQFQRKRLLGE